MWVVTVFNHPNDIRIFEYSTKSEATKALQTLSKNSVLTYTK